MKQQQQTAIIIMFVKLEGTDGVAFDRMKLDARTSYSRYRFFMETFLM